MKTFLFIFALTTAVSAFADSFFGATFMTQQEAQKKWGTKKFDPAKFKSASTSEKGAMATDVIKTKSYVGKDMLVVRKELGTPDSYFFSDTIFAYKITPSKANVESWQLVFIPDENLIKVKEVRIHKKCCYANPL